MITLPAEIISEIENYTSGIQLIVPLPCLPRLSSVAPGETHIVQSSGEGKHLKIKIKKIILEQLKDYDPYDNGIATPLFSDTGDSLIFRLTDAFDGIQLSLAPPIMSFLFENVDPYID